MENLPDTNLTISQLQRAKELLAQGQHQEALLLALDALQAVLNNLRQALLNLERNLARVQEDKDRGINTQRDMEALATLIRETKSRTYH